MGDIADMMIDGTLDEVTGEYLGKPCGYPRTRTRVRDLATSGISKKRIPCPVCGRRVKHAGLKDHMRDKHGEE